MLMIRRGSVRNSLDVFVHSAEANADLRIMRDLELSLEERATIPKFVNEYTLTTMLKEARAGDAGRYFVMNDKFEWSDHVSMPNAMQEFYFAKNIARLIAITCNAGRPFVVVSMRKF